MLLEPMCSPSTDTGHVCRAHSQPGQAAAKLHETRDSVAALFSAHCILGSQTPGISVQDPPGLRAVEAMHHAPCTRALWDARPSPLGTAGSVCCKEGPGSWDQQMLLFMEEIFFGRNSFQGTVANV